MNTIKIIRDRKAMQRHCRGLRAAGKTIGFVPTMGYLHEGHLSLLRAARPKCDVLVLSIYVNPTQFAPGEDLDQYPRDEDNDLALAGECGTDIAFCPDALYPPGYQTNVSVQELRKPLCGLSRPVHFDGVATVVTKLFHLVQPHLAVFGEKDFQQLAVIRRLVIDLDFDVEILGMPIVREADGLAMSSRNAYLSASERQEALALRRGLLAMRDAFDAGERQAEALARIVRAEIGKSPAIALEYAELRDAASLELVERVAAPSVFAVAAKLGVTRLIDNEQLSP